jgi:hypothetical protein
MALFFDRDVQNLREGDCASNLRLATALKSFVLLYTSCNSFGIIFCEPVFCKSLKTILRV